MQKTVFLIFQGLLLLILNACSGLISQPREDVPVEDLSVSVDKDQQEQQKTPGEANVSAGDVSIAAVDAGVSEPSSTANPAVLAMLEDARQQTRAGNPEHAAAAIERALSLEPKNALLWSQLAGIRYVQNQWQQAYVLANKSNSLARGNSDLKIQNWRIIEQAKLKQGDAAGAAAARKARQKLESATGNN